METIPRGIGSLQISEDDVLSGALDCFTTPGKEVSMVDANTVAYKPTHLDDAGPYHFIINNQGNQFIDLNATRLYLKVKVKKDDDESIGSEAVAPVNNFNSAFIDYIDINLDMNRVTDLGNTHANIKAYLETIMSYSKSAAETHLQAQGFVMDKYDKFETMTLAANSPFASKQSLIADSNSFTTMGPLFSDFFQTDRFFPPGFKLGVTLHKASDDMLLLSKQKTGAGDAAVYNKYKITVEDIRLFIRHISLTDEVTSNMLSKLASNDLVFPFTKNVIKRVTSNTGSKDFIIPNFVNGSLPRSIIIGLVAHDAMDSLRKNPFYFQHFSLTYAVIKVNGVITPALPYEPNWDSTTGYVREYREFYDNIGISHDDHSTLISPLDYKGGCFFLAFDLAPDKCNGFHKHFRKTGVIDVELRFKNELSNPIVLTGLLSYDSILHINTRKEFKVIY